LTEIVIVAHVVIEFVLIVVFVEYEFVVGTDSVVEVCAFVVAIEVDYWHVFVVVVAIVELVVVKDVVIVGLISMTSLV